ncbi:pentapeptide repeat-containing protein [Enterobacter asburiae]|uniref:pentapeptide repeat-containing protein n=1 Tax=Enterobacter asburiae TaxID=61645 RepID=UPI0009C0C408|nr:pentapeptide repeat-containing protein [Enterobacter asburiae]
MAALKKNKPHKPSSRFIYTIRSMKHVLIAFSLYAAGIFIWTAFFPQLSSFFFQNTSLGLYDKPFWKDFLVNANASILDFLAITIVLYFFETSRNSKEKAEDLHSDLLNYAPHNTVEMNVRKVRIIRKLNEMKVTTIHCERMIIEGLNIKNFDFFDSQLSGLDLNKCNADKLSFKNCTIQGMNLSNTKLKNTKFENCTLKNLIAKNANLKGTKFMDCDLDGADFTNSNLQSATLSNCNLNKVNYTSANLNHASLKESHNIDVNAVNLAKSRKYIKT